MQNFFITLILIIPWAFLICEEKWSFDATSKLMSADINDNSSLITYKFYGYGKFYISVEASPCKCVVISTPNRDQIISEGRGAIEILIEHDGKIGQIIKKINVTIYDLNDFEMDKVVLTTKIHIPSAIKVNRHIIEITQNNSETEMIHIVPDDIVMQNSISVVLSESLKEILKIKERDNVQRGKDINFVYSHQNGLIQGHANITYSLNTGITKTEKIVIVCK